MRKESAPASVLLIVKGPYSITISFTALLGFSYTLFLGDLYLALITLFSREKILVSVILNAYKSSSLKVSLLLLALLSLYSAS
jgi:hypothetical protein